MGRRTKAARASVPPFNRVGPRLSEAVRISPGRQTTVRPLAARAAHPSRHGASALRRQLPHATGSVPGLGWCRRSPRPAAFPCQPLPRGKRSCRRTHLGCADWRRGCISHGRWWLACTLTSRLTSRLVSSVRCVHPGHRCRALCGLPRAITKPACGAGCGRLTQPALSFPLCGRLAGSEPLVFPGEPVAVE